MLISQTDSAGTLYFLPDAQGSTRVLVDGTTGAISSSYEYDAFGNLDENIDLLTDLETNYLYTGQQFDPISELYSLRARYYDPSLGRFLTRDTWPYDYQNPVELNRYVYTANNPVNFYDPSGYGLVERILLNAQQTIASSSFSTYFQNFATGFVAGLLGYLAGLTLYSMVKAYLDIYVLPNDSPFRTDLSNDTSDWGVRWQLIFGKNFSEIALLWTAATGGLIGLFNYALDLRMKENLVERFGDSLAFNKALQFVGEEGYVYASLGLIASGYSEFNAQSFQKAYEGTPKSAIRLAVTSIAGALGNLSAYAGTFNLPSSTFLNVIFYSTVNTLASLSSNLLTDYLEST